MSCPSLSLKAQPDRPAMAFQLPHKASMSESAPLRPCPVRERRRQRRLPEWPVAVKLCLPGQVIEWIKASLDRSAVRSARRLRRVLGAEDAPDCVSAPVAYSAYRHIGYCSTNPPPSGQPAKASLAARALLAGSHLSQSRVPADLPNCRSWYQSIMAPYHTCANTDWN